MPIDQEHLEKIAHLSRLELKKEDIPALLRDMNEVLAWVEQLREVDTTGVAPLTSMTQEVNAWRTDQPSTPLERTSGLQSSPAHDDQFFLVPKVLE